MAPSSVGRELQSRVIEPRNGLYRWSLRGRKFVGSMEAPLRSGAEVRPGSESRAEQYRVSREAGRASCYHLATAPFGGCGKSRGGRATASRNTTRRRALEPQRRVRMPAARARRAPPGPGSPVDRITPHAVVRGQPRRGPAPPLPALVECPQHPEDAEAEARKHGHSGGEREHPPALPVPWRPREPKKGAGPNGPAPGKRT